jgi:hypothetical protein
MLHWTHPAPFVPQAPSVGGSQLAPAQQPFAQFMGVQPVHTPPTQFWSVGQPEHTEPPVPQAAFAVPARHIPPEQQPVGQDVSSHTHDPPKHRWPGAQAPLEPHAHAPFEHSLAVAVQVVQTPPFVPHDVTVCASHTPLWQQPPGHEVALQTHDPPWHACPCAHSLPPPHEQPPPVQPSERVASHDTHATPDLPQLESAWPVHVVPFSQHPLGHDVALHTQAPPTHC